MTEERFRELLADYLAGELDEQQAAAFRAELKANAERRKLADELQAAAAALEANVLSDDEARRRTEDLQLSVAPSRKRPRPVERTAGHQRLFAVLRYAAIIVLAFGAGFLARGRQSETPETSGASLAQTTEINDRYVANFVRATQSFPESSSFSRSLLMLARK